MGLARICGWIAVALAVTAAPALAGEPVPIAVASQSGVYASLPLFIASEKGWWEAVGLKPVLLRFGGSEFQLEETGWDVGQLDPLAALRAAADDAELLTVGIADDESDANVVMARPKEVETIIADPAAIKGKTLLLTPGSTAEYAALACLARWRVKREEVHVIAREQPDIVTSFAAADDGLAALTAPDNYTVFEAGAGITVCSGKDAAAAIPGALVARAAFAAAHPERVARFVAVVLHAIAWQKTHRDETIALMRRYYEDNGVYLGEDSLAQEIDTRPTFTLSEQLQLLDRSKGGVSTADGWFGRLAAYLLSAGAFDAPPLGQSYLTDRYLKWAAGDPALHAFVDGE